MDFALIIPCYNYAPHLAKTFSRLEQWRNQHPELERMKVFFVDDGSTDQTVPLLQKFINKNNSWCRLHCHSLNQGKGAAIRNGFHLVAQEKLEYTVFTDCDLHYGLAIILERILPALQSADAVIVDRSWVQESKHQTFSRRLASALFNRAVALLTGVLFHDTQAGLKGFRTTKFQHVFNMATIKGFSFDVEILSIAIFYRLRITQVPVAFSADYQFPEQTTIRLLRVSLKMLKDLLKINFNWKRGRYTSAELSQLIDQTTYHIQMDPTRRL